MSLLNINDIVKKITSTPTTISKLFDILKIYNIGRQIPAQVEELFNNTTTSEIQLINESMKLILYDYSTSYDITQILTSLLLRYPVYFGKPKLNSYYDLKSK